MSYNIEHSMWNDSGTIAIYSKSGSIALLISSGSTCKEITIKTGEEIEALGRSLMAGKKWIEDQEEIARKKRAEEMINKGKAEGIE